MGRKQKGGVGFHALICLSIDACVGDVIQQINRENSHNRVVRTLTEPVFLALNRDFIISVYVLRITHCSRTLHITLFSVSHCSFRLSVTHKIWLCYLFFWKDWLKKTAQLHMVRSFSCKRDNWLEKAGREITFTLNDCLSLVYLSNWLWFPARQNLTSQDLLGSTFTSGFTVIIIREKNLQAILPIVLIISVPHPSVFSANPLSS